MPYVAYNGPIGIQPEGAIILTADELTSDMLIAVVNPGAIITVTTLGALASFVNIGTGLINNGGVLTLVDDTGWPTDNGGVPGSLWSNGLAVSVVPGGTPIAQPAVFFGEITSTALLALGGLGLPTTSPAEGSSQLWNLGGEVLVA